MFNSNDDLMKRLAYLEDQVNFMRNYMEAYFVSGRLRTDRAIPASSTEVYAGIDLLGDRIITDTYEYILVNNTGVLEWIRLSASTF